MVLDGMKNSQGNHILLIANNVTIDQAKERVLELWRQ
jgi:hypothetical protein